MSDTYHERIRNLINVGLNDDFLHEPSKPTLPLQSSLFSPKSQSSERLTDDAFSLLFDIWSESELRKPQYPFRADRSMSLTDNYSSNFTPSNKVKSLDVPPPPGFPPLAAQPSNRYKTELCRSFQENGSCKYGGKCQFAHGENELRGLHRHPKYKTEACRTFYNFGYCPYGSRCHFIHEEKHSALQSFDLKPQASASLHPRLLRQSVSCTGFLSSRSVSPPAPYEPMGFTRAPSTSPPPSDVLSPAFNDTNGDMFLFAQNKPEAEVHNLKSLHCMCGQGQPSSNKCVGLETRSGAFPFSHASMQRFASDESLSDGESYSSTGSSSSSESFIFDNSVSKRLGVFARMSVSE